MTDGDVSSPQTPQTPPSKQFARSMTAGDLEVVGTKRHTCWIDGPRLFNQKSNEVMSTPNQRQRSKHFGPKPILEIASQASELCFSGGPPRLSDSWKKALYDQVARPDFVGKAAFSTRGESGFSTQF